MASPRPIRPTSGGRRGLPGPDTSPLPPPEPAPADDALLSLPELIERRRKLRHAAQIARNVDDEVAYNAIEHEYDRLNCVRYVGPLPPWS